MTSIASRPYSFHRTSARVSHDVRTDTRRASIQRVFHQLLHTRTQVWHYLRPSHAAHIACRERRDPCIVRHGQRDVERRGASRTTRASPRRYASTRGLCHVVRLMDLHAATGTLQAGPPTIMAGVIAQPATLSAVERVPLEVWARIFAYLAPEEIRVARQVCTRRF